jgi:hypothetical protein
MLQWVRSCRARAVAWWQRAHADPEKRDFRRIGVVSFGVVGASVVLAKLTQDTSMATVVRAFAITMFGLAAIALLAVVILMGEEVVEKMDETDPMRARRGGAYGPRIKRSFRDVWRSIRAWVSSRPASVAALRHNVTRDSFRRLAAASAEALSGVPPADVGPPRGAGRLARVGTAPPPPAPTEPEPAAPVTPDAATPRARRRALTASELGDSAGVTALTSTRSRRPGRASAARRPLRPTRRSERAAQRAGRASNPGGRSTL